MSNYRESDISLEQRFKELLIDMGIDSSVSGFRYIVYAVQLIHESLKKDQIPRTVDVYKVVASKFGSTKSRVERAIRYVQESLPSDSLGRYKVDPTNNSRMLHSLEVKYSRMEEEDKLENGKKDES